VTSALDGGEWSASHPGCFTFRERDPGTHWIGGWVGPRARLERSGEEKNSQPPPGIDSLIIHAVAQRCTSDRSFTSTPLYVCMAWHLVKHMEDFTCTFYV
jgi:hypothetical protein